MQHSKSSSSSGQSLQPLDVPKELWRLVDYIFMNGLNEVSFLKPCYPHISSMTVLLFALVNLSSFLLHLNSHKWSLEACSDFLYPFYIFYTKLVSCANFMLFVELLSD